jgi:ring-1,2-phenylacetyl-CoA epoxidase subunit PaaD
MVKIETDNIWKILEEVVDPEIPVLTIQDLGILQDVKFEGKKIVVTIVPTYTGCPAMDMITVNIKSALQNHGYNDVEVKLVLEPTWTTDWISEEGRIKMKNYGITPPQEKSTDIRSLLGKGTIVPCPRCDSTSTKLISHFGSTACKAFYQCNDCKEPFDYFKCH